MFVRVFRFISVLFSRKVELHLDSSMWSPMKLQCNACYRSKVGVLSEHQKCQSVGRALTRETASSWTWATWVSCEESEGYWYCKKNLKITLFVSANSLVVRSLPPLSPPNAFLSALYCLVPIKAKNAHKYNLKKIITLFALCIFTGDLPVVWFKE